MERSLETVDIDMLSHAVIIGNRNNHKTGNNPDENSHLSLMMDVLFMILCRTIQSGNPVLQDQPLD
ncbi:MAG: hypothetical protein WAN47_08415 [Nitrosotalea sp.]